MIASTLNRRLLCAVGLALGLCLASPTWADKKGQQGKGKDDKKHDVIQIDLNKLQPDLAKRLLELSEKKGDARKQENNKAEDDKKGDKSKAKKDDDDDKKGSKSKASSGGFRGEQTGQHDDDDKKGNKSKAKQEDDDDDKKGDKGKGKKDDDDKKHGKKKGD